MVPFDAFCSMIWPHFSLFMEHLHVSKGRLPVCRLSCISWDRPEAARRDGTFACLPGCGGSLGGPKLLLITGRNKYLLIIYVY